MSGRSLNLEVAVKLNPVSISLISVLVFHTAFLAFELWPHLCILIEKQKLSSLALRAEGTSTSGYMVISGIT